MKRTDLKLLLQILVTVSFILFAKQVPSVFSQSTNIVSQDKTKEEIERVANQQLDQAAKKFKEKQYWQSAIDLVFILDSYTDFSKLDEVIYLLGNSLYEMEIYDGADLMYRYLLKTIPKTPLLPDVILALQKVYYQKKEYQQSLKFYTALEGHYSLNKGIDESRY
ncbi:MAG: tol-pal system YbgF family protein, partial [bacterium]